MPIQHVLAVAPVRDLGEASEWYERLLGRAPDNRPMDTLVEWQVVPGGWLQVFEDPKRAGNTSVNFAVDDLDAHITEIGSRGIECEPVQGASKGVRLSSVADPDGNRVTFIGGFRVRY